MRIFELIQSKTITRKRPIRFNPGIRDKMYTKHQQHYYGNKPATGLYSKGRPSISDPFMFTKITARPIDTYDDAYFNYIKRIKNYMGQNPYFPRVYVTKINVDSEQMKIPKYQIEKLFDKKYLERHFDMSDVSAYLSNKILNDPSRSEHLFHIIRDALRNGNYQRIKDKELVQALKIIKDIKDKSNDRFDYDLHDGNFLYRIGPTGIQLVIADPLA